MYADVKGALNQIDKSWKAFTVKGYNLTKPAVKRILEYAVAKGYENTGQLRDSEIDHLLNKGTTIEQWERYYVELEQHEKRVECNKPVPPPLYFTHYKPTDKFPSHAETAEEAARIYKIAVSEWEMMRSCDAPNKPGYYRANND